MKSFGRVRSESLGKSWLWEPQIYDEYEKISEDRDITGGSGAKTLCFQRRGPGFDTWSRSQGAQTGKYLPAEQKTWVRSLSQEDSSGEQNGNPLQCSCLENAMDKEPGGLQFMGS